MHRGSGSFYPRRNDKTPSYWHLAYPEPGHKEASLLGGDDDGLQGGVGCTPSRFNYRAAVVVVVQGAA